MVLIHDEGHRINWRLAVIRDLITGGDGLVRAADIQTSTERTNRPVTKLYPLEVTADTGTEVPSNQIQDTTGAKGETSATTPTYERRPQRTSARKAVEKMAGWRQTLLGPPEDVKM